MIKAFSLEYPLPNDTDFLGLLSEASNTLSADNGAHLDILIRDHLRFMTSTFGRERQLAMIKGSAIVTAPALTDLISEDTSLEVKIKALSSLRNVIFIKEARRKNNTIIKEAVLSKIKNNTYSELFALAGLLALNYEQFIEDKFVARKCIESTYPAVRYVAAYLLANQKNISTQDLGILIDAALRPCPYSAAATAIAKAFNDNLHGKEHLRAIILKLKERKIEYIDSHRTLLAFDNFSEYYPALI